MFCDLLKGIYYYSEEQRLLAEERRLRACGFFFYSSGTSGDQGAVPGGDKESQCRVGPLLGPSKLGIRRESGKCQT